MEPTLGPAYRILTPRLVIRCWAPSDAVLLKSAIDDSLEHLRTFLPWARSEPQPLSAKIELLRRFRGEFDLGSDFFYGVFDREESEVVGGAGLHTRAGTGAREIGYWIRRRFVRKGLATEAAAALTRVAFEVDEVERVEIRCAVENIASAGIPKKLGFLLEGTLRSRRVLPDADPEDLFLFTMLQDEYVSSPLPAHKVEAFDAAGFRLL